MWNPDAPVFITNALSPAQILNVELDAEQGIATVVVPDKQLSLAIGKEGQNARLAAKLTGWRIDIKSAAAAEAEKIAKAKSLTKTEEKEVEEEAIIEKEPAAEIPAILEPASVSVEAPADQATKEKPQLRFVEDISVPGPVKPTAKAKKKKKKGTYAKVSAEDGIKLKKRRREPDTIEPDTIEEVEEY
jgi:N utilization substance protein A